MRRTRPRLSLDDAPGRLRPEPLSSADPDFDQTHWAPARRRGQLPTHYYHAHFEELLGFVEERYRHILSPDQRDLIGSFRALDINARRLYVRLVNRKGRVFSAARLRYPELGDAEPLLKTLQAAGWVEPAGIDHYFELLRFLTKRELNRVLAQRLTGIGRSMKKAELVYLAERHCGAAEFLETLGAHRILVQRHADDIGFMLFLFFGRVQDGLSQFTLRDLGLVRVQDTGDDYEPRFAERSEALETWFFARQRHRLRGSDDATIERLARAARDWPAPVHPAGAAARDELAHALGRALEKTDQVNAALRVYKRGESTQCSERVVRLLLADGRRDEARTFLERCIDAPRSDEQALMAEDLYARKFDRKRTSAVTDELRAAPVIELDESRSGSPEQAAAEWFESRGVRAWRTENRLWRTLFGLLLWDDLFGSKGGGTHSPFERLPAALLDGTFAACRHDRITARLALLDDPGAARRELLTTSTRHYGTPNGVFRWRRDLLDPVFALLEHADADAVRNILARMCRDYRELRYGYPDLMLVENGKVRFVEIKTEGDQLRRNQLVRIAQLRDAGFDAGVVRVDWIIDPLQTYVVVDVETTGGRGERHRVTEIGAVKVRGGEIVDRFQTLLNPARSIPPDIIRLTGITPAMVADAPVFADIADRFREFMGDAIFVAHNVDFDYGFIAGEYRRLGQRFRHPRLCTCASMRRLFPGHRSYGLAALCASFGIALEQHHRALCDAEAAAELLLLINEKRTMLSGSSPAAAAQADP